MRLPRPTTIRQLIYTVQGVPLVVGLVAVVILQLFIFHIEHATAQEQAARQAIERSLTVQAHVAQVVLALFLYSRTNDEDNLRVYTRTRDELQKLSDHLNSLDIPVEEQALTSKISWLCRQFISNCDESIDLMRLGGTDFATVRLEELRQEGEQMVDEWTGLTRDLDEMVNREADRSPVSSSSYARTLAQLLSATMVAVFGACLVTSNLLSRHVGRRLSVIEQNSDRISKMPAQPLLPQLAGSDEIAQLDQTFHSMVQSIAESTKREREILETAAAVIFTCTSDLIIKSVSPSCASVWNCSVADVTERSLTEILRSQERLSDSFDGAIDSATSVITEVSLLVRGGGDIDGSLAISWSPATQLFSCVFHDISERKALERVSRENEARIRELIDNMPAGLLLIDAGGLVVSANAMARRLLLSSEDAISKPVETLLPGWKAESPKVMQVTLGSGGNERFVEVTTERLETNSSVDRIVILIDVTQQQQLHQLRQQLFGGIIAEVADPLKSINATLDAIDVANDSAFYDRAQRNLEGARKEARRLMRLFTDLLEVEGSHIRQLSISKRSVMLSDLVERAVQAVSVSAEKRNVQVVTAGADCAVQVDPDRMVQVLVNLCHNALKFTPSGGTITITTNSAGGDGFIAVDDTGRGLPEGMEQAIFEPFKQTSIRDCIEKGGAGLGLFICRSIVERHGGTIVASNNLAGGARFSVSVPLSLKTEDGL